MKDLKERRFQKIVAIASHTMLVEPQDVERYLAGQRSRGVEAFLSGFYPGWLEKRKKRLVATREDT